MQQCTPADRFAFLAVITAGCRCVAEAAAAAAARISRCRPELIDVGHGRPEAKPVPIGCSPFLILTNTELNTLSTGPSSFSDATNNPTLAGWLEARHAWTPGLTMGGAWGAMFGQEKRTKRTLMYTGRQNLPEWEKRGSRAASRHRPPAPEEKVPLTQFRGVPSLSTDVVFRILPDRV